MNRKSFLRSLSAAAVAPFIWPKLPALVAQVPEEPVMFKPPITIHLDGIDPTDPYHRRLMEETFKRYKEITG